ncbi:hypothetical protein C5B85_15765 [Pseudoclavibacter sp. AY1F1]|uniref:hypothetical protein n=1 Tax=Pseudoclavibacter sp. AY1F1 TaxID=2080583 RepID=UPI000CE8FD53|nr:hypothetical protein [Pseudoclavibacter sp. AY1F1]PPF42724.1 hypothetical protein C5B85_15765 [Pseudoclavibacter sp. AY1F1]
MKKLMLNTYVWVAIAFYIVALIDLGNDGSIWIVWFALGLVFTVIAYRGPKPKTRADAYDDSPNDNSSSGGSSRSSSSSEETP